MEVAIIDWKSIDSKFIKDDLYENIDAPQWIDFFVPADSVDDEAWFCRPDCNHPKTVEDFIRAMPNSKLQSSASVSEILPLGDRNRRDASLKRRGITQPILSPNRDSKYDSFVENSENQNPNFSTPPNNKTRFMKETIKSSTEKKQADNSSQKEETPGLKSTLSARNLFVGRDILNQVTEFCNELKRMAMRAKDGENVDRLNLKKSPVAVKKQEMKECPDDNLEDLDEKEKGRKPLLEVVSKEKCEAMEKSNLKENQRKKKRNDETENTPISVDVKNIRRKEQGNLLQIRTRPPSPQCFSTSRGPTKATPPKALRSRPLERGILQELEQSNKDVRKVEPGDKANHGRDVSVDAEREARTLDVFWFLKPCTLSS